MKTLFICKKRHNYGQPGNKKEVAYGLNNSASFNSNALENAGIESKIVVVVDNNCIDREVSIFKPDFVFIEALWVVPSKFEILIKLHPTVKWVIRNHSEIPFLANEGIAIDWLFKYQKLQEKYPKQFFISSNSEVCVSDLKEIGIDNHYLPNIYCPPDYGDYSSPTHPYDEIHIGCFGSIRPLKNHLSQAIAAIAFAEYLGKKLKFHINGNRVEQSGDNNLKNIRNLFENFSKHELIEHPWMEHRNFYRFVSTMDMGMQVSFTESFNIVTADFVKNKVPIVVSNDIKWMPCLTKSSPNSIYSIWKALRRVYILNGFSSWISKIALKKYNKKSLKIWLKFLYTHQDAK